MTRTLIIALLALATTSCTRSKLVRIVVPTDTFVGWLIVEQGPDGADITREDDSFVLRFPTSGRLLLRDVEFLTGWKRYECSTASGEVIPCHAFERSDFEGRALWPKGVRYDLGSSSVAVRAQHRFFVGTRSELEDQLSRDKKAIKPPNQALQTTPMTRSGTEKTIEFGRPQRGV